MIWKPPCVYWGCWWERLTNGKVVMAASLVHGTTLGEAGIESFSPIARIIMRQFEKKEYRSAHKFVGKLSAISVDEDDNVHETLRLYRTSLNSDAISVAIINIINNKFDSCDTYAVVDGEQVVGVQNCKIASVINHRLVNSKIAREHDLNHNYDQWVAKLIDAAEWDELQEEADLLLAMWSDTDTPFPEAARERRNELANLGVDINGGWVPSR